MRWTERQRAMLAEMGIRLWERDVAVEVDGRADAAVARADAAAEVDEAPVKVREAAEVIAEPRRAHSANAPSPRDGGVALPAADWLIVGEPLDAGAQNAQAQLLDNMLRAIGVARDAPGRDGRAAYFALADKPGAGDDGSAQARVRAAIEAVRPRCVVALGRHAAQALGAGDEPLGALRGRVHVGRGVPVVVTCSLAFLLRHGEEKARAWADLCLAVRTFDEATA